MGKGSMYVAGGMYAWVYFGFISSLTRQKKNATLESPLSETSSLYTSALVEELTW